MGDLLPESYPRLLREIKARIQKAQYEALKAVNKELIALYWDIGRMIADGKRMPLGAKRLWSNRRRTYS